ncbi:MAG: GNAT family N-acetyltransferase [Candidatus Uhrbacteria bacterium]|nr:GNAT family N-acetyltransferase [Candidatus Uhrbacteria bacterium]
MQHLAPDALHELKDFERKHRLKLLDSKGELAGFAEMVYFGKPVPMYYLEYMQINESHRGKGYGGELIEQVNAFIKDKGKMGLLVNAIEEDKASHDMYLAHGWRETYIPDLLILNPPNGLSDDDIADLEKRVMKWTDGVYEKSENAA